MVAQKNSAKKRNAKTPKAVETESFMPTPDDFVKWLYIMVRECSGHISIDKRSPMPEKIRMDFSHHGNIIDIDIPEMRKRKKKKKSKIIVPDDSLIVPDKSITFPRIVKGLDHGG